MRCLVRSEIIRLHLTFKKKSPASVQEHQGRGSETHPMEIGDFSCAM